MRIDISRIREIDRNMVLIAVALIAGIAVSVWLIQGVSKEEKAVDALKGEVDTLQAQADAITKPTTSLLTPEQLSERISPLVVSKAFTVADLQQQVAEAATQNHLTGVQTKSQTVIVNATATEGEDLTLQAMGIARYFVLTVDFQATYEHASAFLNALEQLPQRVQINAAELKRDPPSIPKIQGTVTLRLYQKDS
jgi:uncharacterized protein YoxC